mgnify:CR=1 FL=1|jgi:SET domain-containing protein|tara:strand:- start:2177 stop:2557 length:381 start_codon:yes stop_codon:yes gene_type:complete
MTRSVYKTSLYKNPKVEVRRSPLQGWGVFAIEALEQFELIEECPIVVVENEELGNPQNLSRYFANLKGHDKVFIGLGFGSLYNHSQDPSVEWYVDGINLTQNYYTTKPVEAGEELFSCYNPQLTFE